MSKQIQKSLRHGLSKIKISNKHIQHSLRSCKHIKTPSFSSMKKNRIANEETDNDDSVTLSDIDQFLYDNFRTLYRQEYEQELCKKTEQLNTSPSSSSSSSNPNLESPRDFYPPPPLENLCGSARFFVPTSSSSSMIIDEISSNDSSTNETVVDDSPGGSSSGGPDNFITLLTYSRSPYDDFRQSMEEMVKARLDHNGTVDWEFMEELLFCYLDLNNEKSHRAIMRAFVDLIVALRENSVRIPMSRRQVKKGNVV